MAVCQPAVCQHRHHMTHAAVARKSAEMTLTSHTIGERREKLQASNANNESGQEKSKGRAVEAIRCPLSLPCMHACADRALGC